MENFAKRNKEVLNQKEIKSLFDNLKGDYFLEKLFNNLKIKKSLDIIKYNNKIKKD